MISFCGGRKWVVGTVIGIHHLRLKTRCALVQVSEVARLRLGAPPPAAPAPVARHIPAPAPATDTDIAAVAHGTRNQ